MPKKISNKEPEPSTDDRAYIGARIDQHTKRRLEEKAKWSRRSLSAEIEMALEFWVKQ